MASLSLKSLAILFVLIANALGESTPAPTAAPATSAKPVRIAFLPPPLEGTISLGIYDAKGKLVRVLHREADLDALEAGKDALLTTWDGLNDAGEKMPAGKYHARGFVVGEVDVEGVGFHFNDWIDDEQSPRVRKISKLWHQENQLILGADVLGAESAHLVCDDAGNVVGLYTKFLPTGDLKGSTSPPATNPVAWTMGKAGTVWLIERASDAGEHEVKQYSAKHELVRRLKIASSDPQPIAIAASTTAERLFLLEQSDTVQRVRALTLLASAESDGQAVSDWKVDFEKKITAHQNFTIAGGQPVVSAGSAPPEKATIKLRANPLEKDTATSLEIAVGFDSAGSFLKTADGLPLQSISETKSLVRVVIAPRDAKSLDVFQDDTAVVEQFRITALDQMMAFDCGDFELN